jgi:sec-independent protein translocase protein TatA
MSVLFGIFELGPSEMVIVGIVAVLLFGKRLPEVGRSFGKGLMEFKKGLNGIQNEIAAATREVTSTTPSSGTTSTPSPRSDINDYAEATAPKFEPPTAEPHAESAGA